jgi:hypothetical protein
MNARYIAIAVLATGLGALGIQFRAGRAIRFQKYYAALHQAQPELNTWQRMLVSLALTTAASDGAND